MHIYEINSLLESRKYDFLRNNLNLKNHLCLITLGGSYAYGMNQDFSDIDIRGVAINSYQEILLGKDFDQIVDVETDTTIYSMNKFLNLLTSCNPNTIEILGCKPEYYFIKTDIGEKLIDMRKMFLSKVCIHTFGGYASSQLRRLENKAARLISQEKNEQYILESVQRAMYSISDKYPDMKPDEKLELFIDKSNQEGYDTEIYMNVALNHYPLRDWTGLWNEMKCIVSSYTKIGRRNERAMSHDKLGKHMAHLLRLYMMVIDILEKEEIITYREDEHDLLMSIRNGEFLDENRQPRNEFYEILDDYEKRFKYAQENTSLPDKPNYKEIDEFKMYVNEFIVKNKM